MADLRDKYGNVVYRIEGDRINDIYGNWKYEIRGEYLFDTYGKRLGEMKDLAELLELSSDFNNSNESMSRPQRPKREEPGSVAEWIGLILGFIISPYFELGLWKKYTADRKDWWSTLFRMFIFGSIFGGILFNSTQNIVAIIIWTILTLLPIVVVSISRMHGIGKPWWWILIPGANFIMCGFFPGKY
jgi:hypothetical protein